MSSQFQKAAADALAFGMGALMVDSDGAKYIPSADMSGVPDDPAELRPPLEYSGHRWHWIEHTAAGGINPWNWLDGCWISPIGRGYTPKEAMMAECRPRYLGPAEWQPKLRSSAELVERVARAIAAWSSYAETPTQPAWPVYVGAAEAAVTECGKTMQMVTPGMWSDETVRQAQARIAELEAENRRLEWQSRLAGERTDLLLQGWATREDILDSVVTADQVRALGWVRDAATGHWHAAGRVFDRPTASWTAPQKDVIVAPNGALPTCPRCDAHTDTSRYDAVTGRTVAEASVGAPSGVAASQPSQRGRHHVAHPNMGRAIRSRMDIGVRLP